MRRLINKASRIVYNFRLKKLQTFFKQKFNPTSNSVVISGTSRGGTTWLLEVLEGTTKGFSIWEPIHPENIKKFYPNSCQLSEKDLPKNKALKRYIDNVLAGHFIIEPFLQKNLKFKSYKKVDFLVVKFCRLNEVLPWFTKNYPSNKVVQIYRNPLAVVSSQLRHGAWDTLVQKQQYEFTSRAYSKKYYDQFDDVLSKIKHPEEILAARWALEIIPTLFVNSKNVYCIKYEDLFLQPEKHFIEIYNFIGKDAPKDLMNWIKKPSSTTKSGSYILSDYRKQLHTWKKHLSTDQIIRVRNILKQFGFDNIGDIDYDLKLSRDIQLPAKDL